PPQPAQPPSAMSGGPPGSRPLLHVLQLACTIPPSAGWTVVGVAILGVGKAAVPNSSLAGSAPCCALAQPVQHSASAAAATAQVRNRVFRLREGLPFTA